MDTQGFQSLVKQISDGSFSRNQHFEAYREPEVREASKRAARLGALTRMLASHQGPDLEVDLRRSGQRWCLTCRSACLKSTWSAFLQPYEVELLAGTPRIRRLLQQAQVVL